MSRLAAVLRDALPEEQRRFYDAVRAIRRSPVSGPFIVTMNSSPDLAARIDAGSAGARIEETFTAVQRASLCRSDR